MKLRSLFILAILSVLLAACNFTLAADVTPPPNYVMPTPMPTLGPSYPSQPMNIYNGAAIFVEKCAPCHGATGLGDGEQGKQLPVRVTAIGLADIANKAQPVAWYKQVTQGNIDRFMPPFASLNDQERWDVVGYAFFLHMDTEQMDRGKALVESNCADCAKYFSDLKTMSMLSGDDIVAIIKNGKDEIPAFGKDLTDEELADAAVYLRSLTFATGHGSSAAPEVATPVAESTPEDGTQTESTESSVTAEPVADAGSVSGSVDNQTGAAFPRDAKVILHGYEHGGDMNAGPQEVVTLETSLNADGSYLFDNVETLENRIFLVEVFVGGMSYSSEYVIVEPGMTAVVIPVTTVYGITTDMSGLSMDNVTVHFDFSTADKINAVIMYSMHNTGSESILVQLENEGKDIPFILAPANSEALGFQTTQDSAPFVGTEDQSGFYLLPTDQAYELMAFTSIPKDEKTEFSQKFLLSVGTVDILVPEGVSISGDQFTDDGLSTLQDMDGKPLNFQNYSATGVKADDTITFTITGEPSAPVVDAAGTEAPKNNNLLIGIGGFGLALILLGAWLFIRDRKKTDVADEEDDEEEDEFDDMDDVMDAIIALDDLHRSGKISDEAYKQRREELKTKLKK